MRIEGKGDRTRQEKGGEAIKIDKRQKKKKRGCVVQTNLPLRAPIPALSASSRNPTGGTVFC